MARGDRRHQFWMLVLLLLGIAGVATIVTLGPDAVDSTALVVGLR
jgi:hypothetical protein